MSEAIVKLETEGLSLIQSARQLQIRDAESYQEGSVLVRNLARFIKAWDDLLDPVVRSIDASLKVARGQRDKIRVPAVEMKREIGARMETWDRAERDYLQAEQARLTAEAQEKAQLEALIAAESRGDEAAVVIIASDDTPAAMVFSPPVQEPPKAEGISYRDIWSAHVTNLSVLIQAVASGQAPRNTVMENQKVLDGLARTLKEAFSLPGVEVKKQRVPSVRS